MITRILPWVGAVAVAWTCAPALAQSSSTDPNPMGPTERSPAESSWTRDRSQDPRRGTDMAGRGIAETGYRNESFGGERLDGRFDPRQDRYSNQTMFADAHGDFMLKRDRWRPQAQASLLLQPNQSIDSESGDFSLAHGNARIEVPIPVYRDGYLIAGAEFHHRNYLSDVRANGGTVGIGDQNLFGMGLIFGGGFFVQDDILVEAVLRPGLRTDFGGTLHGDDTRLFMRSRVEWRLQEDLFLKGGLDYDETYKDVNLLPLIGLSWMPIDEWRVDIMLPKYAEITYQHDNYLSFTLGLDVSGDEYHVRSFPSGGGPLVRNDINVQEIRLGFGGEYRFDDYMSVFGRVGINLAGDYKFGDARDGTQATGTLDPGAFFFAGFGYDF